jgi:hypothetical protein
MVIGTTSMVGPWPAGRNHSNGGVRRGRAEAGANPTIEGLAPAPTSDTLGQTLTPLAIQRRYH